MTVGRKTSVDFTRVRCYVIRIPKAYHTGMSSMFRKCALVVALVVSTFPVAYACPWEGTVSNIPQSSAMTKEASDDAERYIKSNPYDEKMIVDIGSRSTFAFVYERNGCLGYGDSALRNALSQLNSENKEIRDVCVTADGSYVIIIGEEEWGYRSRGAPDELTIYMKQACRSDNRIYSAAFNTKGGYILITEKFILLKQNSQVAMRRINSVHDKFGKAKSCCMTDAGFVVCCERGVVAFNIPQSLAKKLNEESGAIPDYIKFEDSGQYFIYGRKVNGAKFCSWWLW